MNLLVKKVKRAGCGFANFQHYRLQPLSVSLNRKYPRE